MSEYVLRHLADTTVRRDLPSVVRQERGCTARVVAYIAEFDFRRLYLADGCPDMHTYCVEILHYSDDSTWRRTRAASTARSFPAIFDMLADGRLHLTTVCLLAPFLTSENCDALLAAAVHKSKRAIELLLAEQFPGPDLPTRLVALSAQPSIVRAACAGPSDTEHPESAAVADPTSQPCATAPARSYNVAPAKIAPLAPERFGLQVTIDRETHELLRKAQDLLSHQIPNGNVAAVPKRVLEIAVPKLESRKFGAGRKSSTPSRAGGRNVRYIPSPIRHAVAKRDGHRCTFVSANGHRCGASKLLEFDHIKPVALGGVTSIANLRLRCRAHNQHEAALALGSEFMKQRQALAAQARAGC